MDRAVTIVAFECRNCHQIDVTLFAFGIVALIAFECVKLCVQRWSAQRKIGMWVVAAIAVVGK